MNDTRIATAEWRWAIVSSVLLLLVTLFAYLLAFSAGAPDHRFMGSLFDPMDGASYLAKMAQGARGHWLFHLPYTPDTHRPVFLYTFYLFLGHIATWLMMPPILVYHTIRTIGGFAMLMMLYLFVAQWTSDRSQRRITWGLAAVGSGFGWLLIVRGPLTPDITMPEGFLMFSVFANAHFPWIIATVIYLAHTLSSVILEESQGWPGLTARTLGLVIATLFLMMLAPYALLPMGLGVVVLLGRLWWQHKRFPTRELFWAALVPVVSLPQLIYGLWAISEANPALHAWHQQSQTLSPPVWQYLVAYGPLLLLALPAIWTTWGRIREGQDEGDIFLLGWLVINALLLYAPFSVLQRRFNTGLILPLAIFAGRGVTSVILPRCEQSRRPKVIAAILGLTALSTILVVTLSTQSVVALNNSFFVDRDEQDALAWLGTHASETDIVLSLPALSLYVPVESAARVVYGHPYETVNARQRLAAVTAFYAGDDCGVVADERVTVIVWDSERVQRGLPAQSQAGLLVGKRRYFPALTRNLFALRK